MTGTRLLAVEVERFKSYSERYRLDLTPITVLIGRNNSGKSALIQPLLLMKQTLAFARPEVVLHLDGDFVQSRNIRDLTSGWPLQSGSSVQGPAFAWEWEFTVDIAEARKRWVNSNLNTVATRARLPWLEGGRQLLAVRMELTFREVDGIIGIRSLVFRLLRPNKATAVFERSEDGFVMTWNGKYTAHGDAIKFDHFLPYIDTASVYLGRNDPTRAYLNGWLTCFAPAIEELRQILSGLQYLSSAREAPKDQYERVATPPDGVGSSGSLAADLFKSRGAELVHYVPPLDFSDSKLLLPTNVRERPLREAVNDVLNELGVKGQFSVEDAELFGYRLLFGKASLPHVGRGLTYLLPIVEVGLLGDPCRFTSIGDNHPLDRYREKSGRSMLIALEEPESHIHPKVQSRLAHWLVALARCQRQFIIETHSDHLVRRLRGLVARAGKGTEFERWLLDSIRIYGVSQTDGKSELKEMRLTPEGGIEEWPADFMDEASEEDSAIYTAALDKKDEGPLVPFIHDEGGQEPESER